VGTYDAALESIREGVERSDQIMALRAQVKSEVVARARRERVG